jgi:hypothetical protein
MVMTSDSALKITDKLDFIKMKNFCSVKDIVKQVVR